MTTHSSALSAKDDPSPLRNLVNPGYFCLTTIFCTMRSPSPGWFTARPLDSYPTADEDGGAEDTSVFYGAPSWTYRFFAPLSSVVLFSRHPCSRLVAVLVLSCVAAWCTLASFFHDTLFRWEGIPPGLWSHEGTLKVGKAVFHLKGVSWYGFEGPTHCLEGLNKNSLGNILDVVARHNFNALRLPLAFDKWKKNPLIASTAISSFANPDLKRLPYRKLVRAVIERAASKNILVLLDMHRLDASIWPSDGKWFSSDVSPENLIGMWEELAREFGSQWNVIGADVFNEVCLTRFHIS